MPHVFEGGLMNANGQLCSFATHLYDRHNKSKRFIQCAISTWRSNLYSVERASLCFYIVICMTTEHPCGILHKWKFTFQFDDECYYRMWQQVSFTNFVIKSCIWLNESLINLLGHILKPLSSIVLICNQIIIELILALWHTDMLYIYVSWV